jgi:hypothetical protein
VQPQAGPAPDAGRASGDIPRVRRPHSLPREIGDAAAGSSHERAFRRSDYRFLAVCLLLLAAATWFSVGNFYRAFPEASIDFRVSRGEGESIASAFLTRHRFDTRDYRSAAAFTFDDHAKTFLEREAGLERANDLMGTRVRLGRWSYRWFRPRQKEEFRVDVTPRGDVAGFRHELDEDAARPAMAPEPARGLAEDFLRYTMRRDPAALDFRSQRGRLPAGGSLLHVEGVILT